MALLDTLKNKYNNIAVSLKESLFSKNKNFLRTKEFNKKSVLKQSLLFSLVNSLGIFPFLLGTAINHKLMIEVVPSIFLLFAGFFLLNFTYLTARKSVFLIIEWVKTTTPETYTNQEIPTEFFEQNFIGKIKQIFTTFGSVAFSYIPLMVLIDSIVLGIFTIPYFQQLSAFHILKALLAIDVATVFSMSFITTFMIYLVKSGFTLLGLSNKNNEQIKTDEQQNYVPKRSFPEKEFSLSLSEEFKKTHHVENIYDELKSVTDNKTKQKTTNMD